MNPTDRSGRLWGLLCEHAAKTGSTVTTQAVCAVAVEALSVVGASLAVITDSARWESPSCSDELASRLEELQFTLSEGPGVDAVVAGGPVLVDDLAGRASAVRWPVFAPAAAAAGAQAMFVFPMHSGAIRAGLLTVYRVEVGPLTYGQMADAVVLAELGLLVMLHAADGVAPDAPGWTGDGLSAGRAQVYQATGMVSVQLGVALDEALVRLRAYAFTTDRLLVEVAADVVAHRVRFDPEPT